MSSECVVSVTTCSSTRRFSVSPDVFDSVLVGDTNLVVAAILTGSWLQLLSDSPLDEIKTGVSCQKPWKVFNSFYRTLTSDIRSTISSLSALGQALIDYTTNPDTRTYASTSEFLRKYMHTPVFPEVLYFVQTESKTVFQYLLTFFLLGKKTEFVDDSLHATAFRKWCAVEDKLDLLTLEIQRGKHDQLLHDLAIVMKVILPDPAGEDFYPHHGPGAVNGPQRGDIEKSFDLCITPKIERLFSKFAPFRGYLENTDNLDFIRSTLFSTKSSQRSADISRLMFVVKNNSTSRSICEEPPQVMLVQQGVRALLEQAISEGPLGHYVHLKDQSRNQGGALFGSSTGLADTLDLSSASDSVHADVIRRVFPRAWHHLLFASRTSQVLLPDKTVRRVSKFAPMGSAVCFPVQCILYSAIVILAYLRYARPLLTVVTEEAVSDILSDIPHVFSRGGSLISMAVYGDDIICDCRVTDDVIDILTALKFEVNLTKSYYGDHQFRESCGVYALSGIDVTPMIPHLKHTEDLTDVNPNYFSSMISMINRSGDFGYTHVQSFLINVLLRWGMTDGRKRAVLFSSRAYGATNEELPMGSIFTRNPHNSHLKHRLNSSLQRIEARHISVLSKTRVTETTVSSEKRPSWDAYSYNMYWRAINMRSERGDDDFTTPRVVSLGTTLGWVWTPSED